MVNEIVTDVVQGAMQVEWINNDKKKINMYDDGLIIIDRGPISTLSYNETQDLLTGNSELLDVYSFFKQYQSIYNDSVTYYLKRRNNDNYYIPFDDEFNPYGSVKNQQLLEKVTLHNCYKICNKFKIIDYDYQNMEDLINEIIDQYLCS